MLAVKLPVDAARSEVFDPEEFLDAVFAHQRISSDTILSPWSSKM
jgi:hypothetical protein